MDDVKLATSQFRLDQWKTIIADCQNSGLSAREYLRQNQIREGAYYYWLHKIRKSYLNPALSVTVANSQTTELAVTPVKEPPAKPVEFAPLPLQGAPNPQPSLLIQAGVFHLDISESVSLPLLKKVLAAIRSVES